MQLIEKITLLSVGFSVISALLLMVTYSIVYRRLNKSWLSISSAVVLLSVFIVIQILHMNYLGDYPSLFEKKYYVFLVLLSAPAFYLFVREYINVVRPPSLILFMHLIPVLIGCLLPNRWAIPFAFFVGAVYSMVCVYYLFYLKEERKRFIFELVALTFFLLIAVAIFALGLLLPLIDLNYFISCYAILIAISFVLVVGTLLMYPEVALNLTEAVEQKYAKTTLEKLDTSTVLAKLEKLMKEEQLYYDESLNLSSVATLLDIKPYQLSELINTQFGYGFPKYIRSHRINAAKERLLSKPNESILSVSLSVGFNSQSSFYSAFKTLVGTSPSEFRKRSQSS